MADGLDDLFSKIDSEKPVEEVTNTSTVKEIDENNVKQTDNLFDKLNDSTKSEDEDEVNEDEQEVDDQNENEDQESSEDQEEKDDEDTKYFKKNIVKEKFFQEFLDEKVKEEIAEYEKSFLADFEQDEETKAFFEFRKNGGSLDQFLEQRSKIGSVPEKATDKDNQKLFLKQYMKMRGIPETAIENSVEALDEVSLIKSYEEAYADYSKVVANQRQELVQQQEQIKAAQVQKQQENNLNLKNILKESEDIFGVTLDTKTKNKLYDYGTKIQSNNNMTKLQTDLIDIFEKQDDRLIKLMYLVENNMSLNGIEKKLNSKVVNNTKQKIKDYRKAASLKSGSKRNDVSVKGLENLAKSFFN